MFQLSHLPLHKFELIKETTVQIEGQDHARTVYRAPPSFELNNETNLFIKVWKASYIRRDNMVNALNVGFYDENTVPALVGLIWQAGVCRGYVLRAGRRMWFGHRSFYRLIQAKTAETGYFHVQYSRSHTVRVNQQPSLIDLEAVYPLTDLPLVATHHSAFDNAAYAQFVGHQYAQKVIEDPTAELEPGLLPLIPSQRPKPLK